jgi:flagellar export protein FliJ
MAFHFPLQAVLHLRQSLEHQQELRLRAANQQVSQMQYGIEQVEIRRVELGDAQSRDLAAGITSAELRFGLQCATQLGRYKFELERQLAGMQRVRDQQSEIFQEARRKREMLEGVRDRQWRQYQQDTLRRQQRDLDDLFLLRRDYLRRG